MTIELEYIDKDKLNYCVYSNKFVLIAQVLRLSNKGENYVY